MKTVTVKLRKKTSINYLRKLEDQKIISIVKETPQKKFKDRLKKNIEEGLHEVELHRQGKIKLKSLDELINEL